MTRSEGMSMLWCEAEISLFHGATVAAPAKTTTISAVLQSIRTGTYHQSIKRLRHILATQGDSAYTAAKARLATVTFCGTFTPDACQGQFAPAECHCARGSRPSSRRPGRQGGRLSRCAHRLLLRLPQWRWTQAWSRSYAAFLTRSSAGNATCEPVRMRRRLNFRQETP